MLTYMYHGSLRKENHLPKQWYQTSVYFYLFICYCMSVFVYRYVHISRMSMEASDSLWLELETAASFPAEMLGIELHSSEGVACALN